MYRIDSRSSNMAVIYEIDYIFNNYSLITTCCQLGIKHEKKVIKITVHGILRLGSSNLATSLEVDRILINYARFVTCCHLYFKYGQKVIQIGVCGIFVKFKFSNYFGN